MTIDVQLQHLIMSINLHRHSLSMVEGWLVEYENSKKSGDESEAEKYKNRYLEDSKENASFSAKLTQQIKAAISILHSNKVDVTPLLRIKSALRLTSSVEFEKVWQECECKIEVMYLNSKEATINYSTSAEEKIAALLISTDEAIIQSLFKKPYQTADELTKTAGFEIDTIKKRLAKKNVLHKKKLVTNVRTKGYTLTPLGIDVAKCISTHDTL